MRKLFFVFLAFVCVFSMSTAVFAHEVPAKEQVKSVNVLMDKYGQLKVTFWSNHAGNPYGEEVNLVGGSSATKVTFNVDEFDKPVLWLQHDVFPGKWVFDLTNDALLAKLKHVGKLKDGVLTLSCDDRAYGQLLGPQPKKKQ